MLQYILKRILWAIPTLIVISLLSFIIIQLPPGDYLTAHLAALRQALDELAVPIDILRVAEQEAGSLVDRPLKEEASNPFEDLGCCTKISMLHHELQDLGPQIVL